MPFSLLKLTKLQVIGSLSLLLIVFAAIGAIPLLRTTFPNPTTVHTSASTISLQSKPSEGEIEVEHITLRTYGFEPREIKRPKGDFVLSVDNRTRKKDLSLQLSRILNNNKGEKLKDVSLAKGKVNHLETLSLPPGDYVLTESENPRWECRIAITPK
jgi:hypothetical protein